MSRDDRLGRLSESLAGAITAGEDIDVAQWAARFEVAEREVAECVAAVRALQGALGEDLPDDLALSPPPLPEDYEVVGELGRGGMGVVYRVRQRSLGRDVALKVLRPGDLVFGEAIARFRREARSLAKLRHRHIVTVHEVGESAGLLYFTMDLIEGESLADLVARGEMTPSRAVKLLRQVASAVAYAHGQGVVHRDLKPANILVDADGDAFVVDFGLARDAGAGGGLTVSGNLLGTPAYMAPEQAKGDSARIGEASDVYALGTVLYECLTHQPPFCAASLVELMTAIVEAEPLRPRRANPQVPRDLEIVCLKAMAKAPADRYPTVQAFAEDLERCAEGREILARPPALHRKATVWLRRHRTALLSAVVGAAVLALLMAWLVLPGLRWNQRRTVAELLHARGEHAVAVAEYREVLAGAPESQRVAVQLQLVDALVEAGLAADAVGESERARALWDEAATLGLHSRIPDFIRNERTLAAPWFRALLRALAAAEDDAGLGAWTRNIPGWCPLTDLLDLLREDLVRTDAPGQRLALRVLAELVTWELQHRPVTQWLAELGAPGPRVLLRMFDGRAAYPVPVRERLERGLMGTWEGRSADWRPFAALFSAELERLLFAEAFAETRADEDTRILARMLARSGDLPPLMPAEPDPDFDVEEWVRLHSEGTDETTREEALAERMQHTFIVLAVPDGLESEHLGRVEAWLREHTGADLRGRDALRSWWDQHREERPSTWLARAGGLGDGAADKDRVLARLLVEGQPLRRAALHHLLTLLVTQELDPPRYAAYDAAGLNLAWLRAFDVVPETRYRVRVGCLVLDDTGESRLVCEEHRELRLGERYQLEVELDDPARAYGAQIGLAAPSGEPGGLRGDGLGRVLGYGREGRLRAQGRLRLSPGGPMLTGTAGVSVRFPSSHGSYGRGLQAEGAQLGEVLATSVKGYSWPDDGSRWTRLLGVMCLEESAADARPWTAEEWEARIPDDMLELDARDRNASDWAEALLGTADPETVAAALTGLREAIERGDPFGGAAVRLRDAVDAGELDPPQWLRAELAVAPAIGLWSQVGPRWPIVLPFALLVAMGLWSTYRCLRRKPGLRWAVALVVSTTALAFFRVNIDGQELVVHWVLYALAAFGALRAASLAPRLGFLPTLAFAVAAFLELGGRLGSCPRPGVWLPLVALGLFAAVHGVAALRRR